VSPLGSVLELVSRLASLSAPALVSVLVSLSAWVSVAVCDA
jgi:hypothetical protein